MDGVGVSGHVNAGPLISLEGNINVHAGVVDAKANVDVDNGGHVSGGVGGHVNVEGVEVGGNVNVDKGGHVSGGASLGVGLGPLGGVDVHVNAGPDGLYKTGMQ
ncbi:hypothetical protein CHS0354_040725 [Potamilus streckersoni]|uniref:Uncharacterized protein n=1 Tax=Potamilus streckersoni TaxID=2493646 RepID=A0AAE0VXU1_9BIVA|nr:hypothetical protein CHS0354_040725 [Potamilus streckersoni]